MNFKVINSKIIKYSAVELHKTHTHESWKDNIDKISNFFKNMYTMTLVTIMVDGDIFNIKLYYSLYF